MYKIIEEKGKLKAKGKHGNESVHLIHCSNTLKELKKDCANIYIVAEECTNFARVHLVTNFSEDEALQQVDEYLREKENVEETHLIGVFECEL